MDLTAWTNFFVISGGASAALTGLVFVAVSVNAERIRESSGLRKMTAQTLVLLMTPLVASVFLVAPVVARTIIGGVCIVGGLSLGAALFAISRGMDLSSESRAIRRLQHLTPSLAVSALIVGAGISVLLDFGGGLYWLVPAVILAFIGGVANAWFFIVRLNI